MAGFSSCQHQVFILPFLVTVLLVLLLLRDSSYRTTRTVYQDTRRAQSEIDQSYILLISNIDDGDEENKKDVAIVPVAKLNYTRAKQVELNSKTRSIFNSKN